MPKVVCPKCGWRFKSQFARVDEKTGQTICQNPSCGFRFPDGEGEVSKPPDPAERKLNDSAGTLPAPSSDRGER